MAVSLLVAVCDPTTWNSGSSPRGGRRRSRPRSRGTWASWELVWQTQQARAALEAVARRPECYVD